MNLFFMLFLNFCCRLVYDICIIGFWHGLSPCSIDASFGTSVVCGVSKNHNRSTVPNKVCKVATWCASDRADAFSTAPATHSGDLSFFPILISVFFFKERNFKDSTGWRSQHWNSILRGLGYFYVTTSCRKRSGDFQMSDISCAKNRRRLDWCWLALTAVLLQSCHLAACCDHQNFQDSNNSKSWGSRPKASTRSISKIFGALAPKGGAGQGFVETFEEFQLVSAKQNLFVYKFW